MYRLNSNNKGAPLDNYFGFFDGARVAISKSMKNQRIMHNDYKKSYRIMVLLQIHMVHKNAQNTILKCFVNRVSWQHSNAQNIWLDIIFFYVSKNNNNLGFDNY